MRRLTRDSARRGMGLVQVLFISAFVALMAVVVAQLGRTFFRSETKVRDALALTELANKLSPVSSIQDLTIWLGQMRLHEPIVSACLPASGVTYACPPNDTAVTGDKNLAALLPAPGGGGTSITLTDDVGTVVAGPNSAPVHYNSDGVICAAASKVCHYLATAYLLRSSAGALTASNPGNVVFVVKIAQDPAQMNPGDATLKPIYKSVSVPSAIWGCNPGYFTFSPTGVPSCYKATACPPVGSPQLLVFAGWNASGTPNCTGVTSNGACPSNMLAVGFNPNGTLKCQ